MSEKKLKAKVELIDSDGNVIVKVYGPRDMMCILDSVIRSYYEDYDMLTDDIPEPCYAAKPISIEHLEGILVRFREAWERVSLRLDKVTGILCANKDIIEPVEDE